jgi:dehydrodolichyl diphosphate syntase complex subunit NUS1
MVTTGLTPAEEAAFRRKQLSVQEREELLKPYLPSEPSSSSESNARTRRRSAQKSKLGKKHGPVKSLLFFATYHFIALLFSIFFRFRRAFRLAYTKLISLLKYHHRTPEFIAGDVSHLEKLPKHLSVIVELNEDDEQQGNAGLEGLVNDVCEIAAWSSSAGITFLSVYERTGKQPQTASQPHTHTCTNYLYNRCIKELSPSNPHLHRSHTGILLRPYAQTNPLTPRTPSVLLLAAHYTPSITQP